MCEPGRSSVSSSSKQVAKLIGEEMPAPWAGLQSSQGRLERD